MRNTLLHYCNLVDTIFDLYSICRLELYINSGALFVLRNKLIIQLGYIKKKGSKYTSSVERFYGPETFSSYLCSCIQMRR